MMWVVLAFCCQAAVAAPGQGVDYSVTPVLNGEELAALMVEMQFRGEADGESRLLLPNKWAGTDKLWQSISDLSIEGGRVESDGNATRRVLHSPGAEITVRYRVAANGMADPDHDYAKAIPVVRPGWFFFHGEGVFAVPEGQETAPAGFAWRAWPARWRVASDLDHLARRPGTVADIVESAAIGAPDLQVVVRSVDGASFRLATRGTWNFKPEALADHVAAVMKAQNRYWNAAGRDYFVPVAPLSTDGAHMSVNGTGRTDGFSVASTTHYRLRDATRFLAHEYMHNWVGRELGGSPADKEAEGYWFTEGFTDFLAARTLVQSGIWSLEDYAAEKNATLFRLATSTARALTNAAAADRFWSDPAAQQLPYDRGNIFALWTDERLRPHGGIDAALRAQRRLADRNRTARKTVAAAELFPAAVRTAGGADLVPAIASHIDRGQPIELPASFAGGCLQVETVKRPLFDRGFDIAATNAAGGVIAGVDPRGRAYAAGLRNGMKLVRREAGETGNPAVEFAYRVADAGGERLVRYLPAGHSSVPMQQLKVPVMSSAKRAACAARL
jgi:predicted metalloprotease with PDZ domain